MNKLVLTLSVASIIVAMEAYPIEHPKRDRPAATVAKKVIPFKSTKKTQLLVAKSAYSNHDADENDTDDDDIIESMLVQTNDRIRKVDDDILITPKIAARLKLARLLALTKARYPDLGKSLAIS